MSQVLTKVTIEGVDVTSSLMNYTVSDSFEDITPAKLVFSTAVLDDLDLAAEQTVVITRGLTTATDSTIFKGVIASVSKSSAVNIVIKCFDELWKLQRIVLNKTYDINIDPEAGVVSAIAEDLIQTYGGLTADVEASGAVVTIDQFVLRNNNLLEKLKQLADLIDYMVYYDPSTDKVVFKTKGFTTFGTILQTGVNLVEVPEWKYDYTKIINDVTIVGGLQEVETTETDTGDGIETQYTLNFRPESVKVFVNSVLKEGGIEGQSASFDYSVDKENKQINFEVAPPNTHSIEFRYSYLVPIKLRQKDPTSIGAYGQYQNEKKIDTILTTDDALVKSTEVLTKFKDPQIKSRLRTYNVMDIKAGDKVQVVDSNNNESRTVVVRRINYNYPVHIDEITVDNIPLYEDYYLKNEIIRRLRQLEKKNQTDNDFTTSVFSVTRDIKPRRRYMELQKQSIAGDTLIWNHVTYGIWNSYKWGDAAQSSRVYGHISYGVYGTNQYGIQAGTFILGHAAYGLLGSSSLGDQTSTIQTVKLVQGDMTYEEYAYDTDFHDSTNSTATFSTVTNDIAFTSGQIWLSSAIDIGTTLTFVTVNLGTVVGTLLIEISSDNKSTWQTITEGVRTAVTSSDGLGTYIRITENAAGVASIDLTKDSFNQVTEPAVKVLMEDI